MAREISIPLCSFKNPFIISGNMYIPIVVLAPIFIFPFSFVFISLIVLIDSSYKLSILLV